MGSGCPTPRETPKVKGGVAEEWRRHDGADLVSNWPADDAPMPTLGCEPKAWHEDRAKGIIHTVTYGCQ